MRFAISLLTATAVLSGLAFTPAHALDPARYRIIDLSHPYNAQTLYWPTSPSRFELRRLHHGHTDAGYFYSANTISTPEHGGTHLDAPVHFYEAGLTVDRLPLHRLVLPGVVSDISDKASGDRNYRLTREDVIAFESAQGTIAAGSAVLVRTGWDRYWPDAGRYLGDDTPGEAGNLAFPGFAEGAARLLIEEREVAMIGIDTASLDYGPSRDFIVHRIAAKHNVAGLENLTKLRQLPARGFTLIALPMKIEGGSGGPVRVIALLEDRKTADN